jgi:hypothetical protein
MSALSALQSQTDFSDRDGIIEDFFMKQRK